MKLRALTIGAAMVLLLTGCAPSSSPADVAGPPTAAPDSTFDPRPDPYTPTPDPLLSPEPAAPIATPTPTPTPEPTAAITFYGTDATFTWTDGNGMHQVQRSGPYTVTLPYHLGMLVNANAVAIVSKDAGCKVTITGDTGTATVVMDNTLAGQTMASCVKSF